MANAIRGEVEAKTSDGRTFTLVFDFNTWADAEDETGLSMKQLVEGLEQASLSAKQQRALFWCALKQHQPEITLREAGSVIIELAQAITAALAAASPPAAEAADQDGEGGAESAEDPQMTTGTGTNS